MLSSFPRDAFATAFFQDRPERGHIAPGEQQSLPGAQSAQWDQDRSAGCLEFGGCPPPGWPRLESLPSGQDGWERHAPNLQEYYPGRTIRPAGVLIHEGSYTTYHTLR
jgi:hypothetical protein